MQRDCGKSINPEAGSVNGFPVSRGAPHGLRCNSIDDFRALARMWEHRAIRLLIQHDHAPREAIDAPAAAFNCAHTRKPLGLQTEWRVAVGDQ